MAIDTVLVKYRHLLAPYWPERSTNLHNFYHDIKAPFELMETPEIQLEETWRSEQYIAHIAS